MGSPCPSFETLGLFAGGGTAAEDFAEHVNGCEACQLVLDELGRFSRCQDRASAPTEWGWPGHSGASDGLPLHVAPAIDGLEILRYLDKGGMGLVFLARQPGLRRVVALKLLADARGDSARRRDQFSHEAQAAASVRHPNVVCVHDFGEIDGRPYLVMEYIAGGDLDDRLKEGTLGQRDAARLVERVADAIEHLHQNGIIHRDLKPSNILVDAGRDVPPGSWVPKVADFGLARPLDDPSRTDTLAEAGTPAYMAPEQADRRGPVGRAADIHALGAVLYRLLTGRPPFQGSSIGETLDLVRRQDPVPPRRFLPKLDRDLETICLRCLQKSPNRRYSSAGAVAEDLRRYLDRRPIKGRRVSPPEHAWRWCLRRPALAGISASLALGLAIGVPLVLTLWVRAELARRESETSLHAATALLANLAGLGTLSGSREGEAHAILQAALGRCQQLLALRPADRNLRLAGADVAFRLGRLETERMSTQRAIDLLGDASALLGTLVSENPRDGEARRRSASAQNALGTALQNAGRDRESADAFEASCRLILPSAGSGADPADRLFLAYSRASHAKALARVRRAEDSRRIWAINRRELGAYLREQPEDRAAMRLLAECVSAMGDEGAAIDLLRHAYSLAPDDTDTRDALSSELLILATRVPLGDRRRALCAEVVALLEPVISSWEKRLEDAPQSLDVARTVYLLRTRQGHALNGLGSPEAVEQCYERCVELGKALASRYPPACPFDPAFPRTLACLADVRLSRQNDPAELETAVAEMRNDLSGLGDPAAEWQTRFAVALLDLAQRRRFARRLDQAECLIVRAGEVLNSIAAELPDKPSYHLAVSEYWNQITKQRSRGPDILATRDARVRALEAVRMALELDPSDKRNRMLLDDRYERLARLDIERRHYLDAESSLGLREQLWPSDEARLKAVGEQYSELAEAIEEGGVEGEEGLERCRRRCLSRAALLGEG